MSDPLIPGPEQRFPVEQASNGGRARPYGNGGAQESPPSEGIQLTRYLSALVRYKWLILLVTGVGAFAGFMVSRTMDPEYAVQTTVWMETPQRGEGNSGPVRPAALLASYAWVDLLNSFAVLDHVARELRLFVSTDHPDDRTLVEEFEVELDVEPGEYVLEVSTDGARYTLSEGGSVIEEGAVGDPIGARVGFIWQPGAEQLWPGREAIFRVRPPRDAARGLASSLEARIDRDGNFMRLELRGSSPVWITNAINAVTDRYVMVAAELKRARLDEWEEILMNQVEYAENALQEAESALERHGIATITLPSRAPSGGAVGEGDPVFQDFFTTSMQLEDIRADRQVIQRALEGSGGGGLSLEALEIVPSVQQSSEMRQALQEATDRRAELRLLRYRYTDQHPAVQDVLTDVQNLEQNEIPTIAMGLIAELQAREANLERRAGSARSSLQQMPTRDIEEMRLRRQVSMADALYTNLQRRVEDARLGAEAGSIPDMQVLDRATVPRNPDSDQRSRILFMATMAGLGLGLLGAILMDRSDNRLRYPEQVSYELGLTILGAVPHVRNGNGRRHVRNSEDSERVMEALRGIRFNLAHAYGSAGPILITVTSPGVGDGKSFICANLALAFAELGHRTLLIDGDVRRGGVHKLVEGVRKPGLTDYLAGVEGKESVIQSTLFPSLDLIGSGTRMSHGPELLASVSMRHFMSELRASYSVILIDSPPLGAAVDPLILGALTGNFLFVVRNGTTDRAFAEAKLEVVDRLPIRILGAVLNDVPASSVYQGYSYLPGYQAVDEEQAGSHGLLSSG